MDTLRGWRHRRAMSIAELAERAGVSNKTINDIELGHVQRPSFRTVKKLCAVLEVEPGDVREFMPKDHVEV